MIVPEGVEINPKTGVINPMTAKYAKRLSDLSEIFQDKNSLARDVERKNDPVVYEVAEYRKEHSDVFFGTTVMFPGRVGREYFMTRGHFHERRDMGEVYYTQSGKGILLLENRDGQSQVVEMRPGVCAFIPPDWAHRSINTGTDKLVFVWVCNPLAGHDYGTILKKGMRKLVLHENGKLKIVDNPSYLNA